MSAISGSLTAELNNMLNNPDQIVTFLANVCSFVALTAQMQPCLITKRLLVGFASAIQLLSTGMPSLLLLLSYVLSAVETLN